jgi:hypothetical protein
MRRRILPFNRLVADLARASRGAEDEEKQDENMKDEKEKSLHPEPARMAEEDENRRRPSVPSRTRERPTPTLFRFPCVRTHLIMQGAVLGWADAISYGLKMLFLIGGWEGGRKEGNITSRTRSGCK